MRWGKALRAVFLPSDAEVAAEETSKIAREIKAELLKIRNSAADVREMASRAIQAVEDSRV